MARQADLFGKTFDQQLDIAAETIGDVDISPNRRIVGEVVFEPMASGVRVTARDDPLASAASALTALESTLAWLRKSLQVKKTSDATFARARSIARIVTDANRQMTIEASSLKGMKSKSDHDAVR